MADKISTDWAKLLKERGLTMRELAKQSGVSYSSVKKVCSGKDLTLVAGAIELRMIAKALGMRVRDLPDWNLRVW